MRVILLDGKDLNFITELDHSEFQSSTAIKAALGGDVNHAIAVWALCTKTTAREIAEFLTWLNANEDKVKSGNGDYNMWGQTKENSPIVDKILHVSNLIKEHGPDNMRTFNLGTWLRLPCTKLNCSLAPVWGFVNKIANSNVSVDTQYIVDVDDSEQFHNVVKAFFCLGNDGLDLSQAGVNVQILAKKLMDFYNNCNNNVLNAVFFYGTQLEVWARYVNVKFLYYTKAEEKGGQNYSVEDLLRITEQVRQYDFASGRCIGIYDEQLITAEDLVNNEILDINDVPSFISLAIYCNGTITISSLANLSLIVTVASAMDLASATSTYTHCLSKTISSGNSNGQYEIDNGKSWSPSEEQVNDVLSYLSQNDNYSVTAIVQAIDWKESELSHSDKNNLVSKMIIKVLDSYNADGTPRDDCCCENPYYSA
jgi:predicted DNA-binding ribbon-helix-helix protein